MEFKVDIALCYIWLMLILVSRITNTLCQPRLTKVTVLPLGFTFWRGLVYRLAKFCCNSLEPLLRYCYFQIFKIFAIHHLRFFNVQIFKSLQGSELAIALSCDIVIA